MIHPHTYVRHDSSGRGYGVFASKALPMGTLICVPDPFDQNVTLESVMAAPLILREKFLTYAYRSVEGHLVLGWDESRYMNHCCQANSLMTAFGFEIAIRDIDEGAEVTTDYGLLNIIEGYAVSCDAQECRHSLVPVPQWAPAALQQQVAEWDRRILPALRVAAHVEDPLSALLTADQQAMLRDFRACESNYLSVSRILLCDS